MTENLPEKPAPAILFYQTEDGHARVEVRLEGETAWLTQTLIAELFQVTVPTVNEHLKGIYGNGELSAEGTIRKFRIVQREGVREVFRGLMGLMRQAPLHGAPEHNDARS
jgi:hypothetical protein